MSIWLIELMRIVNFEITKGKVEFMSDFQLVTLELKKTRESINGLESHTISHRLYLVNKSLSEIHTYKKRGFKYLPPPLRSLALIVHFRYFY